MVLELYLFVCLALTVYINNCIYMIYLIFYLHFVYNLLMQCTVAHSVNTEYGALQILYFSNFFIKSLSYTRLYSDFLTEEQSINCPN